MSKDAKTKQARELDERVLDALARWSAARRQGESLSAAELCADAPEIEEELRDRIRMLEQMGWLDAPETELLSREEGAGVARGGGIDAVTPHGAADVATIAASKDKTVKPPPVGSKIKYIGDYELLAEIARGGMGVVYKARQVRLKRVVALKMILAGDFASDADVQRFHTEAESAAQLDHPHIVPVFEVGEHNGLHYFSMGYVDGASLGARLMEGPLPPREAARIVRAVAQAVAYAHEQGVVHRDLKPGNILIDKDGQPRVTDFGLAKRTKADSGITGTGQILGTPSYMPPEQASGRMDLTREPADIYSLGAVLYAALTGRPPFSADNPLDTLRQVLEREPVSPRQLNAAVPADLETICLKCLEKPISKRYGSAQQVAEELERFLEGKPILARPVGRINRAWRWCKRNKVVAGLLTAVAASLIVGIAVSSYFAYESDRRADENFDLAEKNLDLAEDEKQARGVAEDKTKIALRESANLSLNEAETLCEKSEANVGALWMAHAHGLALEAGDADLADACRAMISGWLNQVPRLERQLAPTPASSASVFGPDDMTVINVAHGRTTTTFAGLRIYDATTGEVLFHLPDVRYVGKSLAISPDRTRLLLRHSETGIRLWSLTDRAWLGEVIQVEGELLDSAYSPRGELLAICNSNGDVVFFSAIDGKPTGVRVNFPQPKIDHSAMTLQFDGEGKTLFSGGYDAKLSRTDVATGAAVGKPVNLGSHVRDIALSPDGGRLALALSPSQLQIRGTDAAMTLYSTGQTLQAVDDIDFSADGTLIVECGRGNQLAFRDGRSAKTLSSMVSFSAIAMSCRFDQAAQRVLVNTTQSIEFWSVPAIVESDYRRVARPSDEFRPVRLTPDTVTTTAEDGFVLHDIKAATVQDGEVRLPSGISCGLPSPDGRHVACAAMTGEVLIVDVQTGKVTSSKEQHLPAPLYLAFSPDGRRVISLNEETVRMWDVPSAAAVGPPLAAAATLRDVSFARDGQIVGVHDRNRSTLQVLSVADGTPDSAPLEFQPGSYSLQAVLTPDGAHVLVLRGYQVELWDRAQRSRVQLLGSHDNRPNQLVITPSGSHAATVGTDDVIRLWDLKAREPVGSPIRHVGNDVVLAVSPDSRFLASNAHASPVLFWHIPTGRSIASPFGRPDLLRPISPKFKARREGFVPMAFSSDSRQLLDLSSRRALQFHDAPADHLQLKLFVETWTGLTLEGSDVRVLNRDEWRKRKEQLASSGWQDPPQETPTARAGRLASELLREGKQLVEVQYGKLRALPVLLRAAALQKQVVEADPQDAAAQAVLGEIYFFLGVDRSRTSTTNPAYVEMLPDFERSKAAYEVAAAAPDATPEWAAGLLKAEGALANHAGDLARLNTVLNRVGEMERRFGPHVDVTNLRAGYLANLAYTHLRTDANECLRLYDESSALYWQLTNSKHRRAAATNLGNILGNQIYVVLPRPLDDPQRIAVREKAPAVVALLDQVAKEYPSHGGPRSALAFLLLNNAEFDIYDGQFATAARDNARSAEICRAMIARGETGFPKVHRHMHLADSNAAYCLARQDDGASWEAAVKHAEYVKTAHVGRALSAKYGWAFNGLALAKYRQGDLVAAKEAIDKSIELRGQPDASDLFWRSLIHEELGDVAAAEADWLAAEEWMKANPGAYPGAFAVDKKLAESYRGGRPQPEPIEAPSTERASRQAADLLREGKELVEAEYGKLKALPVLLRALANQKQAVAANPTDPAAQAVLGEIYFQCGRDRWRGPASDPARSEALPDYQRAIEAYEMAVAHPDARPEWAARLLNVQAMMANSASRDTAGLQQVLERVPGFVERFGEQIELNSAKARLLHQIGNRTLAADQGAAMKLLDESSALLWEAVEGGDTSSAVILGSNISNQVGTVARRPVDDAERKRLKAAAPRCIELLERLHREHPRHGELGGVLQHLLHNFACFDAYEAKTAPAAKGFERAASLAQELIDRGQTRLPGISSMLHLSHTDAAFNFARVENDEAALISAVAHAEFVVELYRKQNKDAPRPDAYNGLAVARFRLGDIAAAKTAIDKALEVRGTGTASDFFWRAVILENLGEQEMAAADWQAGEDWLKANSTVDPVFYAFDKRLAESHRTGRSEPEPLDAPPAAIPAANGGAQP